MRDLPKCLLRSALGLFLVLFICQVGRAQQTDQAKPAQLQDDLSTLKQSVGEMREQQQQIVGALNEIIKVLNANAPRPTTQPPQPPPVSSVSVRGETFRGDSGARVAIIEYADFECPYCSEYERKTFPLLLTNYIETGKVKYFYRDLPLPEHARALPAARAARCAGEQGKFWEMHDSLFAKQNALSAPAFLDRAQTLGLDKAKFTECQSSEKFTADIQKSISEAQQMRIDGTPTFFIGIVEPGGDVTIEKRFNGEAPFDMFKAALNALLARKSE